MNMSDLLVDREIYNTVRTRTRTFRSGQNYVEWSNEEFITRFRFRRETVLQLSEIIKLKMT